MNRERINAIVSEYMDSNMDCEPTNATRLDDLDFLEIAMLIEDEEPLIALPREFVDLVPPPPYATREAFVDALVAYSTSGGNSQFHQPSNDRS